MKKLKTKLIKLPNSRQNQGVLMPDLGLGMLVAILREAHFDVSQLDLKPLFFGSGQGAELQRFFDKAFQQGPAQEHQKATEAIFVFAKDIVKKHELMHYDILGFSLDEETDLMFDLGLVKTFSVLTRKIIVLGGGFRYGRSVMEKCPFVDFLIRGDASVSLKQLLTHLESGRGDLRQIPGLHYRTRGALKINPHLHQAGNADLIPDFSDLDMDHYRVPMSRCEITLNKRQKKDIGRRDLKMGILPYHFIKGCPNACTYCYWNRKRLFKTTLPEKVADNLQFMKERYGIHNFLFLNNSFNPTAQYGEELVRTLERRRLGILWSDSAHPATLSKELFPVLKASGCVQLYYGLESLSPRILKALNRRVDPGTFSETLRESHRHDIFNGVNFLVGIPFEGKRDIRLTRDFIVKNKRYFEYFNINLLQFIEDFAFSKKPADLGISLRELGTAALRNPRHDPRLAELLSFTGINSRATFYSFDERGGLAWEEKNRQDIESVRDLMGVSDRKKKTFFEDIRLIFYLRYIFSSKQRILRWYRE